MTHHDEIVAADEGNVLRVGAKSDELFRLLVRRQASGRVLVLAVKNQVLLVSVEYGMSVRRLL